MDNENLIEDNKKTPPTEKERYLNSRLFDSDSEPEELPPVNLKATARRHCVHEQYPKLSSEIENNVLVLQDNMAENMVLVNKPDFSGLKHERKFIEGDIVYVKNLEISGKLMILIEMFNDKGVYCCTLDRCTRYIVAFPDMHPMWSNAVPKYVKKMTLPMFFGYGPLERCYLRDISNIGFGDIVYFWNKDNHKSYSKVYKVAGTLGVMKGKEMISLSGLLSKYGYGMENFLVSDICPLDMAMVPIEVRDWVIPMYQGQRYDFCFTEQSKLDLAMRVYKDHEKAENKRLRNRQSLRGRPRKGDLERHVVPQLGSLSPAQGGVFVRMPDPIDIEEMNNGEMFFVHDTTIPAGNRLVKFQTDYGLEGTNSGRFTTLDGENHFVIESSSLCDLEDERCPKEITKFVLPMLQGEKWVDIFADWRCLEFCNENKD
jgi:hypothetical protein